MDTGFKMDASLSTIGQGCFGKVYKRTYKGKLAAIKRVPEERLQERSLDRECRIYQQMNHPNIVKLLDSPWREDGKWHFPLEFITGEELEIALFQRRNSKIQLTMPIKATIITGMCQGLHYLHQKRIVHQDLKPDNIMVEYDTYRPVLIDFGVAKIIYCGGISTAPNIGNEAYAAPEIFSGQLRSVKSDVWAMGKVVAELLLECRLDPRRSLSWNLGVRLRGSPYLQPLDTMTSLTCVRRAAMADVIDSIVKAGESFPLGAAPHADKEAESVASGGGFSDPSSQHPTVVARKRGSDFPKAREPPAYAQAQRAAPDRKEIGITRGLGQLTLLDNALSGRGSLLEKVFSEGAQGLLAHPSMEVRKEEHQYFRYVATQVDSTTTSQVTQGRVEKSQGKVVSAEFLESSYKH
nr:PREDICTED: serine/threonine-protein kinase Aurora-3-like [Lepisosteus oculatus]